MNWHIKTLKKEGGGLMLGLFETMGAPWNVDKIPNDFSYGEIEPDWDSKSVCILIKYSYSHVLGFILMDNNFQCCNVSILKWKEWENISRVQ